MEKNEIIADILSQLKKRHQFPGLRYDLGVQDDSTDEVIRAIEMEMDEYIIKPHYETDEDGTTIVWLRFIHENDYSL